jgi:hypothetical protein
VSQLKDLLLIIQTNHIHIYPILLSDAQNAVSIHNSHMIADEIGTLRFYINQSIEAHNIDALQLSLDKSQSVIGQIESNIQLQRQYSDFLNLIIQARNTLIAW